MARWLVLRRELAYNALDAIRQLYQERMAEVQCVRSGDGQTAIQSLHLAAYTPRADLVTDGLQAQYRWQAIDLELHAVCDYLNRSLDPKYAVLIETLEDFCARSDLHTHLTSAEADGIVISSGGVTPVDLREEIDGEQFRTIYTLRCNVRSKV